MEHPAQLEPLMPREGEQQLEDLTIELVAKAASLSRQLHPLVQPAVGNLVRSMNCYYSNLIEGHNTLPREIDRALAQDFSKDPKRRALQQEAVAHIEVQREIDDGRDPAEDPTATAYIRWLHREFCRRLPPELLWVEDPQSEHRVEVVPGTLRDGDVQVGRHVPPAAHALPDFLNRFEHGYAATARSRLRRIIAIAASHHRFLWIHPFYDGNGRVVRLMSHALLRRAGIGSGLWSVSRGLARRSAQYRELLMAADSPRRNDWDGRGNLSEETLTSFCVFFLDTCVDQVSFMEALLQPFDLLRRVQLYVEEETAAGRLPRGAYSILREVILAGEVERGRAPELTGHQERMARNVVSKLLDRGLVTAGGPRAALRLGIPIDVVDRFFPQLYPVAA